MRLATSFPGWVPVSSVTGEFPPDWKTAMLVLLGLYPTVLLELRFLKPHLSFLNPSLATFFGNIGSVAVTSFITMPLFVRWFGWWLFTDKKSSKSRGPLGFGCRRLADDDHRRGVRRRERSPSGSWETVAHDGDSRRPSS
jgi:hypothetical protein